MKYSLWENGDHPVYINPSFKELLELMGKRPNTIRIMEDGKTLGIADSFGNTHNSINVVIRKFVDHKFFGSDYIGVITADGIYWNMEHRTGNREASFKTIKRMLSDKHWEMIKDIENMIG